MTCRYLGVNIAGGEFGDMNALPGTLNQNYVYPSNDQLDYFFDRGFNLIRVPIRWERVQPKIGGPLRYPDIRALDNFIAYAATHNVAVVIDLHNYGYWQGNTILISSPQCSNLAFADVWHKLAVQYAAMPNIIFGLMNEPHDQTASQWASSAQTAINAIRDAGARQMISVPGTYWTGGHSWTTTDNAAVMGQVTDPLKNMVFEVHEYFDADHSGQHYDPVTDPQACITPLRATTDWARAQGKRMFLGEFNVPSDPASCIALSNLMQFLNDNADVWIGGTAWAAGAWWPDNYPFKMSPVAGKDAPQLTVMMRYPHL